MICNTNANGGKVLGVKGSEESEYRKGNVEITPSNLGITVINNTADSNKIVAQAAKLGSTTVGSATNDGISWVKTSYYSDLCDFLLRDAGKAIVAYDSTMRLIVKCTSNSLDGINVPNLMSTIGVPVFIKIK